MVRPASSGGGKYAPVNEASRGGVVKYLSDGASFVVKKRRESAYKQMFTSCGGPYRIVREADRPEGVTTITQRMGAPDQSTAVSTSTTAHYWYIQYACGAAADSTAK